MLDILLNLLALMAAGWLACKLKLVDEHSEKVINDLVYLIGLPALLFSKIAAAHLGADMLPFVFSNALAVGIMVLLPFLAFKLGWLSSKHAALLILGAGFGNIGFMGLPVIQMKWGSDALAPAGLLIAVHSLVVFAAGLWLIAHMQKGPKAGASWTDGLHNPLVLSTLAGLAWSFIGLPLPGPVSYALDSLGSLSIILSLFSMGLFFATHRLGQHLAGSICLSAAKLLVLPALAILALWALHPAGPLAQLTLLEALMPVGVANYVLARRLKLDHALAAEAILLSTLLSLPLLLGFDVLAKAVLGA